MANSKSEGGSSAPKPRKPRSSRSPKPVPEEEPFSNQFNPEVLDKMVIALPLMEILQKDSGDEDKTYDVIIDLNLEYPGGRSKARERIEALLKQITADSETQGIKEATSQRSQQYLFARLQKNAIEELVKRDNAVDPSTVSPQRAIYRIWPDFEVEAFINKSISTVKADAARNAFSALGEGIVWAVLDSGIDEKHPHFNKHQNLDLEEALKPLDFTALKEDSGQPLSDEFGHGTHVAGIIAGEVIATDKEPITVVSRQRDERGEVNVNTMEIDRISGMAPRCKILSLKVLDSKGKGNTSNIIAALEYIQEINGYGRRLRIHGVNLSVGYDFEPKWFACGQSPLCVEVDRLVRSGVVVVVASGNTGYGSVQGTSRGVVSLGMDMSINDPGNAELAITVGSTHRDMPHVYGVSFFSSKGPTGDGRIKPDLVAPGEKIVSCAAGQNLEKYRENLSSLESDAGTIYVEDSGTSMAAPHVSGVIAAFLSVRREFIGQPEKVKEIFLNTATDLKRDRYFQGQGLVDLMRAIQSV
ncbi:S8 family peptidase [Pannus brasiliensis CCIBt3594]|uniref:S8 family peptidase n=1 Tax=Pannus brasiliensis CCIBt3594 TaxID=1427578 RepID=A0AAW9QSD1_9CHRO